MPDGPRCADWARAAGVDPVGTATRATGFLVIDWPLPWPRDAADIDELRPVHGAARASGIRVQLAVPDRDPPQVTLYVQPDGDGGWFRRYDRRSLATGERGAVGAALALLDGDSGDAGEGREPGVEVLLCGHGSRDRCCGSMGTALAVKAAARAIRRTSHTGGHRFAPTAIVLPDGTCWAFLDDDALGRITERTGPLDDLLPRYRGSTAMPSAAAQAAERVAFAEVGWSWLDHRRRTVELGAGKVRIEAVAPDGTARQWEVEVEEGRLLPVPECGRPPEDAPKSEAELVVRR